MKINTISIQHSRKNGQSFKSGLTKYEVNTVNKMGHYEYETIANRLKNLYGINADVGSSNTVAFCLEQVVKIMARAGFHLPKNFSFRPQDMGTLGSYYPGEDEVVINSLYTEFNDLNKQNHLEESQNDFHPDTKHFLHTYLHEFSHAAHFKNLCNIHGYDKGFKLFMDDLVQISPSDIIIAPLRAHWKNWFPNMFEKLVETLCPPENGLYAKTDVTEYIAEYNARSLASNLGDNFIINNIPVNYTTIYKEHPQDWNIKDFESQIRFFKKPKLLYFAANIAIPGLGNTIKTIDTCAISNLYRQDIEYTNGDIWNGNLDSLKKHSLSLKKEHY